MEKFDMDKQAKKIQQDMQPLLAVYLEKKTRNSAQEYFVVVKRDNWFGDNVFHGVGFFTSEKPHKDMQVSEDLKEMWFSYHKIDYIESLMYRTR
jgi:hypothetical protein